MRGLRGIRTGQWIADCIELAGTVRRDDVQVGSGPDLGHVGLSELARLVRATFDWIAIPPRSARCVPLARSKRHAQCIEHACIGLGEVPVRLGVQ